MSISTYDELKTAVANWLNRSTLTSRIPEFIAIGEAKIARKVRCRHNQKRITATISTQYFDLPTAFLEMCNFELGTDPVQHLNYVSPEQMDLFRPTATTGKPKVYTIHGTEFEVKPIPDTSYTAYMTYFYKLTAFSGASDTNDLLTYYPDIYLYAALSAAQPFIENDGRLPVYETLFEAAVKELNDMDKTGRYSGTMLYSKARNIPE